MLITLVNPWNRSDKWSLDCALVRASGTFCSSASGCAPAGSARGTGGARSYPSGARGVGEGGHRANRVPRWPSRPAAVSACAACPCPAHAEREGQRATHRGLPRRPPAFGQAQGLIRADPTATCRAKPVLCSCTSASPPRLCACWWRSKAAAAGRGVPACRTSRWTPSLAATRKPLGWRAPPRRTRRRRRDTRTRRTDGRGHDPAAMLATGREAALNLCRRLALAFGFKPTQADVDAGREPQ
jgi:hypothetical protein